MKKCILILFVFIPIALFSQSERLPVFKQCEGLDLKKIDSCFYKSTKELFFKEFNAPVILEREKYEGTVNVIFLVSKTGVFEIIYLNSPYKELKKEVERVFSTLPIITPASYNNKNIEMRFALPLNFPLQIGNEVIDEILEVKTDKKDISKIVNQNQDKVKFIEHKSQLNIPFNHLRYINYENALNKSNNSHTSVKPYVYNEVNKVYDLDAEKSQFLKSEQTSWIGKKLWNEH